MKLTTSIGLAYDDSKEVSRPPYFILDGSEEEIIYKATYQLLRAISKKYADTKGTSLEDELDLLLCKYKLKKPI